MGGKNSETVGKEFRALYDADARDKSDLLARNLVVVSVGAALTWATGQIIMPLWMIGYTVVSVLHVRYLESKVAAPTERDLRIGSYASAFVACWYCAMVVYISTLGSGEFLMLASCGCVGLALHCLARNQSFTTAAGIDLWATVITSLLVIIIAAWGIERTAAGLSLLVGGVCVIGYFVFSFRAIIAERQDAAAQAREATQAQKMRALGQLTSGVAHDFNNLLTVVSGNIELALLDPDERNSHHYLDQAHAAAARGAELVQQLLAYGRQSQLNAQDVDLTRLFSRLDAVLSRVLPAHVSITTLPPAVPVTIRCDPALLETAILNLVINARDALAEKTGHIRVVTTVDKDASQIGIAVEDNGPGMTSAVLDKAADPFFTTKDVGSGSGLGLSMVKGFAEQSGGKLYLQNRAEGGFRACLTLPVRNPEDD